MELDKDFPKLIALDDKQGHKSKRCLQPPKTPEDKTLSSNSVASSVDVPVVDIDIILHQNESAVPSPSPSTQKVVTDQESLPATNLACEVPKICNQFSALDVLPVSSESEETITEKAATNSGLGLAQDQETPFVAPNVSTESPGNNRDFQYINLVMPQLFFA
ncbi:hypothetical protein YC2023_092567 [Brassica napus]